MNIYIEEARRIYSQACGGDGEDKKFTGKVANLVGRSAESMQDLADHFRCEAQIMQRAYELAHKEAQEIEDLASASRDGIRV